MFLELRKDDLALERDILAWVDHDGLAETCWDEDIKRFVPLLRARIWEAMLQSETEFKMPTEAPASQKFTDIMDRWSKRHGMRLSNNCGSREWRVRWDL